MSGYSTTGSSHLENAQPIALRLGDEDAALAHNGDIVNYERIRRRLQAQGVEFLGSADSETIGQMIAMEYGRIRDLPAAVRRAESELIGGYAVVMLVGSKLLAFRDPLGIRPLVLGTIDGGYAVASESVALELMGGQLVRDLLPGEVILIEKGKLHSSRATTPKETAHCMFEYVYFSRPDSVAQGRSVYDVRQKIGQRLAKESPVDADLVDPRPGFLATAGPRVLPEHRDPVRGGAHQEPVRGTDVHPSRPEAARGRGPREAPSGPGAAQGKEDRAARRFDRPRDDPARDRQDGPGRRGHPRRRAESDVPRSSPRATSGWT